MNRIMRQSHLFLFLVLLSGCGDEGPGEEALGEGPYAVYGPENCRIYVKYVCECHGQGSFDCKRLKKVLHGAKSLVDIDCKNEIVIRKGRDKAERKRCIR
mgnify:CR=1 FL=1